MSTFKTLFILVLALFLFQSCAEDAPLTSSVEDLTMISGSENARSLNLATGLDGVCCDDIDIDFDELYCVYYSVYNNATQEERNKTYSSTSYLSCLKIQSIVIANNQSGLNLTVISVCGLC